MKLLSFKFFIIFIYLISISQLNAIEIENIKNLKIHSKIKKIENIEFYNSKKQLFNLSKFNGKIVILNFWATWCAPCREEMPSLNMLQKKFSNNLKIITVNIGRENFKIINEFLLELNIDAIEPYKSNAIDITKKIKLRGIPTTLIINKKGLEIARALGPIDFQNKDFINWIYQLI